MPSVRRQRYHVAGTPAKPTLASTIDRKENAMLLQNKNAVIYGGGGVIGGAVARAFAREGAKVFLAGRTLAKLDKVACKRHGG